MQPLTDRVALVTGVSRRVGIGTAVASRLHALGATVFATGFAAHDADMPWGRQSIGELPFAVLQHDLEDPDTPTALVDQVVEQYGRIDIVAAVHARSGSGRGLDSVTATDLDGCWAVNVRSVILMAQRFAAAHDPAPPDRPPTGRMLWFTSGQHLGPMDNELDYVVSKGALHQMTATIAATLSGNRIIANCINPGPVDTGYTTGELHSEVAGMFPDGRWGTPGDVSNLVAFLVSDEGAWVRGQVLDSEGGFNRFR